MSKKENVEFVDSKKESDELKGRSIRDILNGSLLTRGIILKNIGFIIWLTFLGIVYIGNSYHAEKVARNINKLQREVKDLRAESITTAADLMYVSRQSIVEQMVKNNRLDLKESVEPPYKIEK
jgi:preprotein translocase subunit SecY